MRTLKHRYRKALLTVHLCSSLGWWGADVALLILAVTGLTSQNADHVRASYVAVSLFVPPALITLSLLSLASGIVLGLGTKWGLFRFTWVTVKLVLTAVLTVLILVLLVPDVAQMQLGATGTDSADAVRADLGAMPGTLIFPPSVSLAVLTTLAAIAVFKPWGRLRNQIPSQRAASRRST